MSKTHRTTISIPLDLKARMDTVDEEINWSAVACRAFEQRLAEVITRRGVQDMKDVAARLRASKQKLTEGRYKEGFDAGQEWAKTTAEADDLERLQNLRDQCFRAGDWELQWETNDRDRHGPADVFVHTIYPQGEAGDREVQVFWEDAAGPDWLALSNDGDFVHGFAEGALEVWGAVKDEL